MSVTLSASAYTLPLLHAARHPASTVLGLLLARGAEIVEALPILHRYASLSLTIDTALRFVRAYAKDNGLTIAGVYIANEDASTNVPRVAERLLETIRKEHPGAIGLVVSTPSSAFVAPRHSFHSMKGCAARWIFSEALRLQGTSAVLDIHASCCRIDRS